MRILFSGPMNWYAARRDADLVVVDVSPYTPWLPVGLGRRAGIALVQNWPSREVTKRKYGALGLMGHHAWRWTLRHCLHFIAVSPSIAARIQETVAGLVSLYVIPYGVADEYHSVPRRRPRHVLYLGRLDLHQKGLDLLIAAYARYRQLGGAFDLVVAGSGASEEVVRALARPLAEHVRFAGRVQGRTKIGLLSEALYLCMPSRYEGWGMVATEAAACGTPTIAFDVDGVRDAVVNGVTGVLIPPFDLDAYSRAMLHLERDAASRTRLATAARQRARQFTWERTAHLQEQAYKEVAGIPRIAGQAHGEHWPASG